MNEKKLQYIHKIEYYSEVKMNGLLIHTTWLNCKIIMLSKIGQTNLIYSDRKQMNGCPGEVCGWMASLTQWT